MAIFKLPKGSSLSDAQFLEVSGPDGLKSGFVWDSNTKTFYSKESQVIIPSQHGATHVADDPIPDATECSPGLMSSDDKVKLDQMLQTRIGVLGFQGAGFPDDGGFLQGDIILAAGSEFISLERFGQTIRFTVDSPLPLNCGCEECATIFWIQDETDTASVRPPSCNGKLPGVNSYGELKVYLLPETLVVDPANPAVALNQKVNAPSFIFKRYDDAVAPGTAELDMVLKRLSSGVAEVGWAMTPGATGVPECVFAMGLDNDGNRITFEFGPESEPGLLGTLLYKGHTLTRQMAVVTGYDSNILSTNCYLVRKWDIQGEDPVGDEFAATNIWMYNNPENSASDQTAPKKRALDATIDIHPVGTLVQLWGFNIGEVNGVAQYRWYFNLKPSFNPENAWVLSDAIKFGDLLEAREEVTGPGIEELTAALSDVSDIRDIERSQWGLTGFDDRLILSDDGVEASSGGTTGEAILTGEPSGEALNEQYLADIDPSLPGLRVFEVSPVSRAERPVFLWHRVNHKNWYSRILVGRPDASVYPPLDILLGTPLDSLDDVYLKVLRRGQFTTGPFAGQRFIVVKGAHWKDIPQSGAVRILTDSNRNKIWRYYNKAAFSSWDDDATVLIGLDELFPFDDDLDVTAGGSFVDVPSLTTVVKILHQEYTGPALRAEFSVNQTPGEEVTQLQFKAGNLDMSTVYELEDEVTPQTVGDNLVRGLEPGYAVSQVYTQVGFIDSVGESIESTPDGFVVYDGGYAIGSAGETTELWNELELLAKDGQLFVWWNKLLIPPSGADSSLLPTPVQVTTPYFPIDQDIGKVGLRLWPGSKIRLMEIWDQAKGFSEFTYGQLEIVDDDTGTGTGSD